MMRPSASEFNPSHNNPSERAGTLRPHDPRVLQRGRGSPRRLRHDQAVHVSGRPQVERGPGLEGESAGHAAAAQTGLDLVSGGRLLLCLARSPSATGGQSRRCCWPTSVISASRDSVPSCPSWTTSPETTASSAGTKPQPRQDTTLCCPSSLSPVHPHCLLSFLSVSCPPRLSPVGFLQNRIELSSNGGGCSVPAVAYRAYNKKR